MWLTRRDFSALPVLFLLVMLAALGRTRAQTATASDTPLHLRAALVLTPEFCATRSKKGSWVAGKETFEIGKAACAELEPTLNRTFSSLARVADATSAGDAEIVLLPRFVDASATRPVDAFSDRELIVCWNGQ